jgi:hypothetical protein
MAWKPQIPRVVWPSGLRRYLGNACVQKFTRKLSPNRNWVRLAKRVVKFAYNEKAKIMQDCINVKSSRNDKVRHLAWKGRNKKKKEAMCKKLHSELNSLKKFKKSTTHWLNTLNQNPYKDSEKYYKYTYTIWWEIHQKLHWKMMQKIKVSNNWLGKNCHMVMCVPGTEKCGVR